MQSDYGEMTVSEKRKFWEEHIRCWRESDLSQRAYCERHEIRPSQWFYWKNRSARTEKSITFVPLKLPSSAVRSNNVSAIRVITPNGFRIELEGASPVSLQQLIRDVAAI